MDKSEAIKIENLHEKTMFIYSDVIVVIEIILIIISIAISLATVFMIKASGLLHIHFMALIQSAYMFFLLCTLSRLIIIIGILAHIENSGKIFMLS